MVEGGGIDEVSPTATNEREGKEGRLINSRETF